MYERLCYISGPYTAPKEWQVEQNIRAAEAAHIALLKKGWSAINPHKMTAHLGGAVVFDYDENHDMFLAGDCAIIKRLKPYPGWDAMYMLPGWQNSKGARTEREVAIACGLTIYERMDDVPDLMKD